MCTGRARVLAAAASAADAVQGLRGQALRLGHLARATRVAPAELLKQTNALETMVQQLKQDCQDGRMQKSGQVLANIHDLTVVDRIGTYRKRKVLGVTTRHKSCVSPAEKALQTTLFDKIVPMKPKFAPLHVSVSRSAPLISVTCYPIDVKEVDPKDDCSRLLDRQYAAVIDWSFKGDHFGSAARMLAAFGVRKVFVSTEVPYRWLRYLPNYRLSSKPHARDCLVGGDALAGSDGVVDALDNPLVVHHADQPLPTARKLGYRVYAIDAYAAYTDHPVAAPLNTLPRLADDEKALFVLPGKQGFSAHVLRHVQHVVTAPPGVSAAAMSPQDFMHVVLARLLPASACSA